MSNLSKAHPGAAKHLLPRRQRRCLHYLQEADSVFRRQLGQQKPGKRRVDVTFYHDDVQRTSDFQSGKAYGSVNDGGRAVPR